MNDNAKAWVAALRSGDYKQSTRVLTRLDEDKKVVGHCCLGVACDLAVKAGVIPYGKLNEISGGYTIVYGEGCTINLPEPVRTWLGLSGNEGQYNEPDGHQCLSALNDSMGKSFEQIADVIESEPKGLFVSEQSETCPECGQPDNCGDCTHEPVE